MSAADPFALGGTGDDTEILALFRHWLILSRAVDAVPESDDDQWNALLDRRDQIEAQILSLRGEGVGLAVKMFLYLKLENQDWAPSLADFRYSEVHDSGGFHPAGTEAFIVSMLRDAAALVPEIGECAVAVVHEDAALIDAQIEIGWCRDRLADKRSPLRGENRQRLAALLNRVANMEAKTERGAAIKTAHPRQEHDLSNVVELFLPPAAERVVADTDPPDAA